MFCPKCGVGEQTAEAYCKRCGEWLPDIEALERPRLFRKRSREERIRKIRTLEMVSAGLSLASAMIIVSILATGRNFEMLNLAVIACLLVSAYQIVNLCPGFKVQRPIDKSRNAPPQVSEYQKPLTELNAANTNEFINPPSITEHTTNRLQPVKRDAK